MLHPQRASAPWWAERFWNHAPGAGLPTGLTSRLADANTTFSVQNEAIGGSLSGKELKFTIGASVDLSAASLDRAGQFADGDILARLHGVETGGGNSKAGPCLRVQGNSASPTMYRAVLRSAAGAGTALRLEKVVAGVVTNVSSPAFAWSADTRYFIRLRAIGTSIRAKVWASGSPEPSAWLISVTDGDITGAGYAGMAGGAAAFDPAFDYIAVSIGDFPAPRP